MTRGYSIIYYDEISSTMDLAFDLVKNSKVDRVLLILAKRQRKGRGRKENDWYSPEGGFWGTFVLPVDTDYTTEKLRFAHYVATLLAIEVLEKFYPVKVSIKWPNDIYHKNKKLGGVLIEYITSERNYLLIGIGINVNNSFQKEKNEEVKQLKNIATSLFDITKQKTEVKKIAKEMAQIFSDKFNKKIIDNLKIVEEVNSKLNCLNNFVVLDRSKKGICRGINKEGLLTIENSEGNYIYVDISYHF